MDPESAVRVSVSFAWTGSSFPGVYRCSVEAVDASGIVVGSSTDEVVALRPAATFTVPVRTTAPPVTARASCETERLDVGQPYRYEFDVDGVRNDAGRGYVAYGLRWLGDGYPGAVTCQVVLLSARGAVVASQPITVFDGSGVGDGELIVPIDEDAEPASAVFEGCEPFVA